MKFAFFTIVFLLAILFTACGPNESILQSGTNTATASNTTPSVPTVESDLADMRTADFAFIYVLRRKDGGEMDAEDRKTIRQETGDANRRISSDNGRAFLIGSNVLLSTQNMTILKERFAVEDFSPPPAANSNATANK